MLGSDEQPPRATETESVACPRRLPEPDSAESRTVAEVPIGGTGMLPDTAPGGRGYRRRMTPERLRELADLRRARDFIDRHHASPLDVPSMAEAACMSPGHFSRRFRATYSETPYGYLMTRRIERAQSLLRAGMSVTDACVEVGCTSLGSFSTRFSEVVGMSPSASTGSWTTVTWSRFRPA